MWSHPYGFAKKSSAALEDHVTRRVALSPSFEVATRELNHSAELLASWLYRLGVSQAESVTLIADGATWIWDRFDWVVATLQLPKAKVQYAMALSMQVFDF